MNVTEPLATDPRAVRGIDRVLSVQRPVVQAHLRSIRRAHPDATPDQVIRMLERRYLAAVTAGGAAVGATAAVPAIGTGTSLVLSGVETAGFLEASALFAQSVAEVHGIVVDDPDRARTLVMTLVLGSAGSDLVKQLVGQVAGTGGTRSAFWGELITKGLPRAVVGKIGDRIKHVFLRRFVAAQGTNVVGRLMPFGIGAVIGGGGNHLLGRQIVRTAREAFGSAPVEFPQWLRAVEPRAPRRLRLPRRRALPAAPAADAAPAE